MANVFLTDEAYARLKAAKKEGQSFSEVVIERVPQEIDWDKYLGIWKGVDAEKMVANIRKARHHR